MIRAVSVFLLLFLCTTEPSFAKVLPGKWDGTCEFISDKYHHKNPNHEPTLQDGYIPPNKQPDNSDFPGCTLSLDTHMGPH